MSSLPSSTPVAFEQPFGTVPAERENSIGRRNRYLGLQLFGYSRKRTDALLDESAAMIERLSAAVADKEALAADADELRAQLARALDELELTRGEAKAKREEAERVVGQTLILAQREATRLVSEAHRQAQEIHDAALHKAEELREESDQLYEAIRLDRERWISTLQQTLRALQSGRHDEVRPNAEVDSPYAAS
jgi:cell division septum initiation protein DivIVA